MRNLFLTLLFVFSFLGSYGQGLTLDSCQSMARKNHPLLRQAGILDKLSELRRQNIQTLNLPQFDLNVRASWQSEVTRLDLKAPGFNGPEPLSKDQYKAFVDIRQKLYDGGVSKTRVALEEADRLISKQQLETELYKIREVVNTLYFNALIVNENLVIIHLKKSTLDERIKTVDSAVRNGMALPNELDQLSAEKLLAEQQETELISTRRTTYDLLEIVTGVTITDQAIFTKSAPLNIAYTNNISRPELTLFSLQKSRLDKNVELLKKSRNPNVFAFGQTGYGRPGLNMLNNHFADWYLVGAGLSWNIFDWHKSTRERSTMKLQKDLIDINLDNFNRSVSLSLNQEYNKVQKLEKLIDTDGQILLLKDRISRRSAVALENGTITSADYIRDLNAALQAKANLETHKVQLMEAAVSYNTIKGEQIKN